MESIQIKKDDIKIIEDVQKVWLSKYRLEDIIKAIFDGDMINVAVYDKDNIIGLIRYKYKDTILDIIDTYISEDRYLIDVVKALFEIIFKKKISQVSIEDGVDKRITDIIDKYGIKSGEDFKITIGEFLDKLSEE
ncbi:MAG: hypothetical protein Q4E69_06005 [Bacilli bacterium]|nr:hypothetical protein [Bacilli bacterium]